MTASTQSKPAVTIIELLVLIIAIATLAAMVVPVTARDISMERRTVCSKNLGHIAQGVVEYATWHDDWIVGSPSGSGAYLQEGTARGHAVQTWDFLGPLDHMWNPDTPLPEPRDIVAVKARFNMLRSKPEYLCPQNHFLAACFGGPDAGVGPMVSYNTCRYQMWTEEEIPSSHGITPPVGWWPSIAAIGSPENKVFCADGARYSTTANPPDYNFSVSDAYGGAFSDSGSFNAHSKSWDRGLAPRNNNPNGGDFDARFYAFRHGLKVRNFNGDIIRATFKMNLAFYDGHVELQGDLAASDPQQWLPSGSILDPSECWPDFIEHFGLSWPVTIGD